MANLSLGILTANIEGWHEARNLIDGSNDQAQYVKLIEEAGELAGNIARGKDVRDSIGDMIVVLINIARRNGHTLVDCLQVAWDDIKDRRGEMRNGTFVKEGDITLGSSYPDIPMDATHVNNDGQFLKFGDKFWKVFVDHEWKVMSGEPIGELIDLNE